MGKKKKRTKTGSNVDTLTGSVTFKLLPAAMLHIDKEYQREDTTTARAIQKAFIPEAVGSLLVGKRDDGTYWIVDGQQRYIGSTALGAKRLPCNVFASKGQQHEAAIFTLVNGGRTSVGPCELFRARCVAGEETAVSTRDMIERHGFSVPKRRGRSWPEFGCPKRLENLCIKGLDVDGEWLLTLLKDAFSERDDKTRRKVLEGDWIGMLCEFRLLYPDAEMKRLVDVCKKIDIVAFLADSKAPTSGSRYKVRAHYFAEYRYNKRLSERRKLATPFNTM